MSKYTSRLTTLENHDTIEDTKLDAVRAPESVRQENAYAGQRDSNTFGKKWQLSWWTPEKHTVAHLCTGLSRP
jgi:hypothetical protein